MRRHIAALTLRLAAVDAQAEGLALKGLDGQAATLSAADVAALPHEPMTITGEGKTIAVRGVPLGLILARVGAPAGKTLRGPELADAVVVTAADGYRVVFALAETDPAMRKDRILLADQDGEGHALGPHDGPFRLVVESDQRPARSARQVTTIELRRLAP